MTGLRRDQLTLHQVKLPLACDLKSAILRHAKPPFSHPTWHGFGWRTVIRLGEAAGARLFVGETVQHKLFESLTPPRSLEADDRIRR
ncbi:MAG TPA: hypothetical protein VE400_21335 [Mycobacterium sp.]|jgi:hypothetical protein|nr:hypothetical protein [Mycobacterium sp.]